ncbi:hypothetical protein ACQEU3_39025 [Spirillospora sp. CA-253888]
MRQVSLNARSMFEVTGDPQGVFRTLLGCAVSLRGQGRPLAEELAERFAPEGRGLIAGDVFVAYRVRTYEDLPDEYLVGGLPPEWRHLSFKPEEETWALIDSFRHGQAPFSELVEGAELRALLAQAAELAEEWRR